LGHAEVTDGSNSKLCYRLGKSTATIDQVWTHGDVCVAVQQSIAKRHVIDPLHLEQHLKLYGGRGVDVYAYWRICGFNEERTTGAGDVVLTWGSRGDAGAEPAPFPEVRFVLLEWDIWDEEEHANASDFFDWLRGVAPKTRDADDA
jgi:hypothetical protein